MVLFESLEKKIETPDALLIDVALPVDFSELFYMEAILDIELVLDFNELYGSHIRHCVGIGLPMDFSELFYMEAILDIELVLDCQLILVSCFIWKLY